jgi:polysaccharide export outer membrane protein
MTYGSTKSQLGGGLKQMFDASDTLGTPRDIRRISHGRFSFAILLVTALTTSGCFGEAPVQTQVVAQPAAAADVGPYKIGRDDVLDVLVWKQEQLSGRIRVASDGTIMLPLIGQVKAAGLTTTELQNDLATRMARFVHDPKVTVRVFDPASRVFYVLGEVSKPGMYKLMSGETLSQALAAAGGPTEYANLRKVKIVRRTGDQQVEMTVNYSDVHNGDLRADVALERGDTITVP